MALEAVYQRIPLRLRRKTRYLMDRVAGKRPVHFLHIRKTGGSAIKYALEQYPIDTSLSLYLHGHRVTLRDIPKGHAFFYAARDPISRYVSGFYSRYRQGQPRYHRPWNDEERTAFESFKTPGQLANALSSKDRTERSKAHAAMRSIRHVNSSYWDWFDDDDYFMSRSDDVLFVGFQERLDEDFEVLKSRLGMPVDATLPKDSVLAHKSPVELDTNLDPDGIENLRKWYDNDYRFIALCERLVSDRLS